MTLSPFQTAAAYIFTALRLKDSSYRTTVNLLFLKGFCNVYTLQQWVRRDSEAEEATPPLNALQKSPSPKLTGEVTMYKGQKRRAKLVAKFTAEALHLCQRETSSHARIFKIAATVGPALEPTGRLVGVRHG
jgi:hypothetical protein